MATFTWLGGSGNWTDSNWSISGPSADDFPGMADIAIISAPGTYTLLAPAVTGAHDVTVNNSNATLQLSGIMGAGATFTIDSGTLSFDATLDNFLFVPSLTNDGTILSTSLGDGVQSIDGAALTNNGVVSVDGHTFGIQASGNFLNTGTIGITNFGSLSILPGATFDNSGLLTLSNGGTLTLEAVPSGPTTGEITFLDGSAAKLSLDAPFGLPTTVEDFQPGNIIDLTTLAFNPSETATLDADAITVFDQGTVAVTIPATGIPLSNSISVSNNGSGSAELTTALACFAAGTRIGTTTGPVPVEGLSIGDYIAAMFAGNTAIEWIGHRRIDCRRHPHPEAVWPVRITARAFGTNQPSSDLWLSPDHAVYVNGVLIPVKDLVNSTTIAQIAVDEIVYYHVALPRHDVLLAEGLAVESYLDADDRFQFSNRDTVVRLHPNFSRVPSSLKWEAEGCAPLVVVGPEVDAVRQMLRERESLVLRSAGRRRAGL